MKKVLMSFLMMAMIAGCVQAPTEAEKPKDVPVVEQPEKPVEQEKPEETAYVKKIDESKDWVVINESITSHFEDDISLQPSESLRFNNGNDFENWYNTIYSNHPTVSNFYINIDVPEVHDLNDSLYQSFVSKTKEPFAEEFLEISYKISDDYLSLFIKSGNFAIGVGHKYEGMLIYNYDLHTGKLLSNDELIERFNFTRESVLIKIQKHYDDVQSNECNFIDLSEEENIGCHGKLDDFLTTFNKKILFINEKGQLCIMINQYLKNKEIYLTTYYEFNLAAH